MDKITIKDLKFSYGRKIILENLNIEINKGMFGLLGRNGAGKSTLMKLIVGLLPTQVGEISVCGYSKIKEIRKVVGYLPQDFDFYPEMRVKEALYYLGVLDNIKRNILRHRVEKLLRLVNLENEQNKKIKKLSGGMKQRLGIAQCLLNDPKVLIVDEPTAGLDPEERIRFRNLLSDLAQEKIVVFSTHIASDLSSTTDQLGIIDAGKLIFQGSINQLLADCSTLTYETIIARDKFDKFRRTHLIFEQIETANGIVVKFLHNGKPDPEFKIIQPTLEAAYLMKIHAARRF